MTKIEYNGTIVNVPDSWADIELARYQIFINDKPTNARGLVSTLAKICGVEDKTLLSLPLDVFNRITDITNFVFEDVKNVKASPNILIDGKLYIIKNDEKLTFGEWIDCEQVQKDGNNVTAKVLAIVCRPQSEEYNSDLIDERAAMFGTQKMDKILPLLSFFLQRNELSMKQIGLCSRIQEAADRLPKNYASCRASGGGTAWSKTWRAAIYYFLIKFFRFRWYRYLTYCYTGGQNTRQWKRKQNSTANGLASIKNSYVFSRFF